MVVDNVVDTQLLVCSNAILTAWFHNLLKAHSTNPIKAVGMMTKAMPKNTSHFPPKSSRRRSRWRAITAATNVATPTITKPQNSLKGKNNRKVAKPPRNTAMASLSVFFLAGAL